MTVTFALVAVLSVSGVSHVEKSRIVLEAGLSGAECLDRMARGVPAIVIEDRAGYVTATISCDPERR